MNLNPSHPIYPSLTSGHWESGGFKGEGVWYGGGCLAKKTVCLLEKLDLTSSHHYGSWQVTAALFHLSSWIYAQIVLASGDTQTPFIQELKFWQVPLQAALLPGMFGNLQRRMQIVAIGKMLSSEQSISKDKDKRTQNRVHNPESLLLFWVLPCVLSFPPWAGSLESTRKA